MNVRHDEFGGLRSMLLTLLLLAAAAAVGWWWFLGRFTLPDAAPARLETPTAVLDYAGRRDLGLDPIDAMVKPEDAKARAAGIDARVYFGRWQVAYLAARVARSQWKAAAGVGAVLDASAAREHAEKARLEYLHQARTAEYWRARYVEAGGS